MSAAEPLTRLALAVAGGAGNAPDIGALMKHLVLQLAVILIAARAGGMLVHRYFRLPGVLGEILAGMLIGPYALGGLPVPGFGALFPPEAAVIPVSAQLYGFATVASILLLFLSGLETDLSAFLRFSAVGLAVGISGVVFSFSIGVLCAVCMGAAHSWLDPSALFLGAVSTATSVGITARILSEKRRTDSPEGVTILAAAVIDDVLGVVVLAIVVGMTKIGGPHGHIDWSQIAAVSAKAIGFWLVFTIAGILSARRISLLLKSLRSPENIVPIALGLALFLAGLMEMAGLAMIIGAYVTGLSLSRTDLAHVIRGHLHGAYTMLVPIFFCVMGMLVDLRTLPAIWLFGLTYTVLAVLAKVVGCALPAGLMDFNLLGAYRVGAGMVPRGEVALIIASIGLSSGAIASHEFSVAIMMTMLTTLLAPPLLSRALDERTGLKRRAAQAEEERSQLISIEFPSADLAEFMVTRLARAFRNEGFFVFQLQEEPPVYQIRKDDMVFTLLQNEMEIVLTTRPRHEYVARLIALEELLILQDLARSIQKMSDLDGLKQSLARGLFENGGE